LGEFILSKRAFDTKNNFIDAPSFETQTVDFIPFPNTSNLRSWSWFASLHDPHWSALLVLGFRGKAGVFPWHEALVYGFAPLDRLFSFQSGDWYQSLRTTKSLAFTRGLTLSRAQPVCIGSAPIWSIPFTHAPKSLWLRTVVIHFTLRKSPQLFPYPRLLTRPLHPFEYSLGEGALGRSQTVEAWLVSNDHANF
jgi:hypothetical protein